MGKAAREALAKAQQAVLSDRVEATSHFEQQLVERGLLWTDILTILDDPTNLEDQGVETHGWPKWRIWGAAADGTSAAMVVAFREDDRVRFITVHWEE